MDCDFDDFTSPIGVSPLDGIQPTPSVATMPCVVCGGRKNVARRKGVPCCYSCDHFFSKSLRYQRHESFQCRWTQDCAFRKINRYKCQYCRFKMCLDAGMRSTGQSERRSQPLVPINESRDPDLHVRRSMPLQEGYCQQQLQQDTSCTEDAESGFRRPLSPITDLCAVCRDVVNIRHRFGVVCCEPCKEFFKRSVRDDKHASYRCPKTKTCSITKHQRGCKLCRFQKCMDVGMRSPGRWRCWNKSQLQQSPACSSHDENVAPPSL